MNSDRTPWLQAMHALVCRQHELVPFLRELHQTTAMQFRPLPSAMLAQLASSPDWCLPTPDVPVLLQLETEAESGGLLVVRDGHDNLFVLAPV